MDQEQIIRIQLIEQEINQLNRQLESIEQNTNEIDELRSSLDIVESDIKDIMTNLGKRIFVPVKVKSERLFIDVGRGYFVKKSIKDTKKIITRERETLVGAKDYVMQRLKDLQKEMERMIANYQEEHEKN